MNLKKLKVILANRDVGLHKLIDDINYIVYNYLDEEKADKIFKESCIEVINSGGFPLKIESKVLYLQKFKTNLIDYVCKDSGFNCKSELENLRVSIGIDNANIQ